MAQSYMSPLHKHASHGGGGPTQYVSTTQTHQSWWWWPNPICLRYTNTPVMVVVAQPNMSPLHKHTSHGGGGPTQYVSATQTHQSWWWWWWPNPICLHYTNTPVTVVVVAQPYMSPLHKHTSHGGGPTLYVSTTQTHHVVAQPNMSPLHKHTSHGGGGGGPTQYVSTTQTHQSWWWWLNPICLHYTNTATGTQMSMEKAD